ncbi:DNA-binding protein [Bifidobacterium panos]|uniref:Helix-turn-helix domain-containing protein n=1 Tax=Bifidobacterium panos TaxID=2675321 RepID=A0ABX1SYA2_9BIFI|nr:DNA-binding protein [Bifidobacterium sp. DSM 109963]NMN02824.1 hypothetical protein [Bifidobacterium sp. DSM 109963]
MNGGELWDTAQTADYLRCSRVTLAQWRSYGGGPPFMKLGYLKPGAQKDTRRILYDADAVRRWAARTRRTRTVAV